MLSELIPILMNSSFVFATIFSPSFVCSHNRHFSIPSLRHRTFDFRVGRWHVFHDQRASLHSHNKRNLFHCNDKVLIVHKGIRIKPKVVEKCTNWSRTGCVWVCVLWNMNHWMVNAAWLEVGIFWMCGAKKIQTVFKPRHGTWGMKYWVSGWRITLNGLTDHMERNYF